MTATYKLTAALTALLLCPGCSIKRMAVNKLGNALASSGTTFEGDDDPELVGDAVPFALKLMESLLAESPKHAGLLMSAASGFTAYSYEYVWLAAERAAPESMTDSLALKARARRLYLRAYAYGMRAMEVRYPGFGAAAAKDLQAALSRVRKRDVELLYWTAAAHGLAISASKSDPEMIAQLSDVQAFIERAMQLDESWNEGALPEFLINVDSARSDLKLEEIRARIDRNYQLALRLSEGHRASLFVSYAENAAIPAQNRARFVELINQAIAIDTDKYPAIRLANIMAQRRARWLLGRADDLFLDAPMETPAQNEPPKGEPECCEP